jgi:choline dehydrogenase
MTERYDFIVVGGGSAGCIVAAKLSEDASTRVLLLEGGPPAEDHPETLAADGYKLAFVNDEVMTERFSVPQTYSAKQRIFAGTGAVMGGSGSVNGMVYTRGSREDYAEWPSGWKWDDIREEFEAIERTLRPHRRPATKWTEACIASAEANGFSRKDDLNDGNLTNVIGYEWMSYEGDARRSSYVAFIRDAGPRDNLTIMTRARAHRVVFTSDGRANAVEFEHDGALQRAEAQREIVICAGALETPKLLMLSGVGPAEHLREHGVPVILDLPAVGSGLHDHPNVPVFYSTKKDIDCFYPQLYSFLRTNRDTDLPPSQSDTCYVYWPAPSAMRQMMQRMVPPKVIPHAFYGPRSRAMVRSIIGSVFKVGAVRRFTDHMFGIILILGKPKSRGTLRLASTNPAQQALIDPAYYSHAEDMETMIKGVRIARRIGASKGLADWGVKELMPGARVQSHDAIARFIRKNTITTYHFAGSCVMGTSTNHAVDTELRVRGVTGLRVADASVMPWTPVSALNAPSMLIGYRASKLLREANASA